MTIKYRLMPSDHWGLNRYVLTHDMRSGGSMLIAGLLVPCFLLLSLLQQGRSVNEAVTPALLVVVVACIVGYPLFRLLAWFKFRALPAHLRTIEMTIQESGIRLTTPKGSQTLNWGSIVRVGSDRQSTYLFLSRRTALIVPLRAFGSRADAETFADLARRHLPGKSS